MFTQITSGIMCKFNFVPSKQLVKTDVQISGSDVSISLIVKGQAGEKYAGGVQKNGQWQQPPAFNIVDEAGKVLTSGRFKYG